MEPRRSTGESGPRPRVPRRGFSDGSRCQTGLSSSFFPSGREEGGSRLRDCLRPRGSPVFLVRGVRTSPGRTPPPVASFQMGGLRPGSLAGSLVVPAPGVPASRRPIKEILMIRRAHARSKRRVFPVRRYGPPRGRAGSSNRAEPSRDDPPEARPSARRRSRPAGAEQTPR